MKPSIGRIVHYIQNNGQPSAAIVTGVRESGAVDLTVFHAEIAPTFAMAVRCADEFEDQMAGVWRWPERVE